MIVSIHHYELAESTTPDEFDAAVHEAAQRGLFDLPGLVDWRFLRGLRGSREGRFAAMWVYEDRQAWQALWGPVDDPASKDDYPDEWRTWEDEILAPLITEDPDEIVHTAFEVTHRRRDR